MTTFLDLTEHNPAEDLVRLVEKQGVRVEGDYSTDVSEEQYETLFDRCAADAEKILASEKAVFSTIFNLFIQMLPLVPNPHLATDLSLKLLKMLVQQPEKHAELKIELLSHLFNMLGDESPARRQVFEQLLDFALRTDTSALLVGRLAAVERWASKWSMDAQESAKLYLLASKVSAQAGASADAQRFRVQFLRTFDDASVKLTDDAIAEAVEACWFAVKESDRCDHLLELRAVDALKSQGDSNSSSKSGPNTGLYELLRIVAVGKVSDFLAWEQKRKTTVADLADHGIQREDLLGKLRTLTLCSLGRRHELLSYDDLRRELQVDSDLDVERCVVAAVRSGLLEAKLDQQLKRVTFTYTIQREFTQDSWKELKPQLATWRDNIKNTLLLLRHASRQALEVQGGH